MVAIAVPRPRTSSSPHHRISERTPPWRRLERRATLRVVSEPQVPAPSSPRQDCASCPSLQNCWQPGIEHRVIVLNLLVCRMKLGIQRDASTKLFLELIRPKLVKMALEAVAKTTCDAEIVLRDFEAQAIQYVLEHYEIGEIAYPLHYLFGFPNGVMRRYSHAYREKLLKQQHEFFSLSEAEDEKAYGGGGGDGLFQRLNMAATQGRIKEMPPAAVQQPTVEEDLDDQKVTQRMDHARAVLGDGRTLPVDEYRVLKFCLMNARDGGFKRPLNGLHMFMSKSMEIPRAKVTKVYSDACEHLVRAVHRTSLV